MEKIMNSVIDALTLERINSDAYGVFAESFQDAYKYMKKEGFKSDPYFKKNFPKISERPGLLDAGLISLLLATYAAGVAAGQGREKIDPKDVLKTKIAMCNKWPQCGPMRIEGFLKALSMLIEWYDLYQ